MAGGSYRLTYGFERQLTIQEWSTVVRAANDVIHYCPDTTTEDVPLYGQLRSKQEADDASSGTVVNHAIPEIISHKDGMPFIKLNGAEGVSADTFILGMDDAQRTIDTRRLPYTFVVMAICIVIAHKLPGVLKVQADDADSADWEMAMAVARCACSGIKGSARAVVACDTIQRPMHMDFRA